MHASTFAKMSRIYFFSKTALDPILHKQTDLYKYVFSFVRGVHEKY